MPGRRARAAAGRRRVRSRGRGGEALPPDLLQALGFTESDSAGQTNIFAVEPKIYVAGSSADKTASGANATLAIGVGAGMLAVFVLGSGLLTVSNTTQSEWRWGGVCVCGGGGGGGPRVHLWRTGRTPRSLPRRAARHAPVACARVSHPAALPPVLLLTPCRLGQHRTQRRVQEPERVQQRFCLAAGAGAGRVSARRRQRALSAQPQQPPSCMNE